MSIRLFRVYLETVYFAENWKLKNVNWKHCSKIIFKCVNSTVEPIFNEKVAKKWSLGVHEHCIEPTSVHCALKKSQKSRLKKKKGKTWKRRHGKRKTRFLNALLILKGVVMSTAQRCHKAKFQYNFLVPFLTSIELT